MSRGRWGTLAVPREVSGLRRTVARWLRGHGVPDDVVSDAQLALSEALTNAAVHAYAAGDPGRVVVEAELRSGDGVLRVVVRDEGGGLAPRPDSPGSGLGMPLMARLTDDLELRVLDAGGTEVEMTFRLAAPATCR